MLSPEDVDLVATFRKITGLMPGVSFDIVMGTLTPDREKEFGEILIDLGESLRRRAERRGLSADPMPQDETKILSERMERIIDASAVTIVDASRKP
ncbi:hypothetical protein JNUCC0626_36410 [Lentzea sp. JNUCC 0626]|uniref:hypothetical protein n=1 Tax=Lentzea sp. JNUCC 0626 TaxID=3367513 RepID=UPI003747A332